MRSSRLARWVRFTGELNKLPAEPAPLLPRYGVRPAVRSEREAVWKVISDSLALDPSWNVTFSELRPLLRGQMEEAFEDSHFSASGGAGGGTSCLALTHGARIIGVSVFTTEPEAENHLLSGPCVYSEYRNRGLGTCLLDRTLRELREAGLVRAQAVTKAGAAAARFVYPKFLGAPAPFEFEAMLAA